jgi:hypothetical protein
MSRLTRLSGMRTATRRALVFGSIVLLATTAVAGPAMAKPTPSGQPAGPTTAVPSGFGSWTEVYQAQEKLDAAAIDILAAGGSGNASIVVSAVTRQLTVYWNGSVPASVQSVADLSGVSVAFKPAAFTLRQLVTEAQRLAADSRIAQVAPKPDGSGLDVTVTGTALVTGQPDLLSSSSVPMTITVGKVPQAMFSRQNDVPLFWGGSRYNSPVGGCSNGFALSVPGAANVFEISAAHCGPGGGNVVIPGQPNPTGSILAVAQCRDTLAINYPAGVGPFIYNGAFNSATGVHVVGATPDFVGNLIETGGASSGEHFNVPVLAVNVFAAIGGIPCAAVGPLTVAGLPGNQCVVAPGDSGGPAYSYASGGVLARGTITAGNLGTAVCPGVVANGGNTVFYAPLLRPAGDPQIGSLQFYGVGILT